MGADGTLAGDVVVSLRNVSKSFGHRKVLDKVNLDIAGGQVHALLGQNGSGKSTLIKILSGIYEPDRSNNSDTQPHLVIRKQQINLPLDPSLAAAAGVNVVHQDLPIIGSASIVENLRIGRFRTGFGWRINWRWERREVAKALRDFGIRGKPDQLAEDLPEADRAMLAILRGLQGLPAHSPGLLVLDEPTAHLPRDGVDRVFAAIRLVAKKGHSVLLITHRLDEVFAITDRVSVIRDGAIRYVADTRQTTERDLIHAILGFALDDLYPERAERRGERVLKISKLSGKRVRDLNLELQQGEIVGVTGLLGAGQEEVPYLLFGARPATSGTIALGDREYPQAEFSPRLAMSLGMALLPADRRAASGESTASICENISLPILQRFFRLGFFDEGKERSHVAGLVQDFEVRPADPLLPLGSLSGGNQQKALLAKWFQTHPGVLLLHEPTHGVDIGSRRTIFRQIKEAASRGAAILLCSAEYADLANLCDRVLVMRNGKQVAELSGNTMTEQMIIAQCMMNDTRPSVIPQVEST
jgi:ribose transport system ATP-binding protein